MICLKWNIFDKGPCIFIQQCQLDLTFFKTRLVYAKNFPTFTFDVFKLGDVLLYEDMLYFFAYAVATSQNIFFTFSSILHSCADFASFVISCLTLHNCTRAQCQCVEKIWIFSVIWKRHTSHFFLIFIPHVHSGNLSIGLGLFIRRYWNFARLDSASEIHTSGILFIEI